MAGTGSSKQAINDRMIFDPSSIGSQFEEVGNPGQHVYHPTHGKDGTVWSTPTAGRAYSPRSSNVSSSHHESEIYSLGPSNSRDQVTPFLHQCDQATYGPHFYRPDPNHNTAGFSTSHYSTRPLNHPSTSTSYRDTTAEPFGHKDSTFEGRRFHTISTAGREPWHIPMLFGERTADTRYSGPQHLGYTKSAYYNTPGRLTSATMPPASPALSSATSLRSSSVPTIISSVQSCGEREHQVWVDKMPRQILSKFRCWKEASFLFADGLSSIKGFLHDNMPADINSVFALMHLAHAWNAWSRRTESSEMQSLLLSDMIRWTQAINDPDDRHRSLSALEATQTSRLNIRDHRELSARPKGHPGTYLRSSNARSPFWNELRDGEVVKLCMNFIKAIEKANSSFLSSKRSLVQSPNIKHMRDLIIRKAQQSGGSRESRINDELRTEVHHFSREIECNLRDLEMLMTLALEDRLSAHPSKLASCRSVLAGFLNEINGDAHWRLEHYDRVIDTIQAFGDDEERHGRASNNPRPSSSRISEASATTLRYTGDEGFNMQSLPPRHRRHGGASVQADRQAYQQGGMIEGRGQVDRISNDYTGVHRRRASGTSTNPSSMAEFSGSQTETEAPRFRGLSDPLPCQHPDDTDCPSVFRGKDRITNRIRHYRDVHEHPTWLPCPHCHKTFKRRSSVKRHCKDHHQD